jgi:hypothetical protein
MILLSEKIFRPRPAHSRCLKSRKGSGIEFLGIEVYPGKNGGSHTLIFVGKRILVYVKKNKW